MRGSCNVTATESLTW